MQSSSNGNFSPCKSKEEGREQNQHNIALMLAQDMQDNCKKDLK